MQFDYRSFRAAYVRGLKREGRWQEEAQAIVSDVHREQHQAAVQAIRTAAEQVKTAELNSFQSALVRAKAVEAVRWQQAQGWGVGYVASGIGRCCSVVERQALAHIEGAMWVQRRERAALNIERLIAEIQDELRREHRMHMTLREMRMEQQWIAL